MFLYIISLKDLSFFIVWCLIDTILYFITTKDYTLSKLDNLNAEKKRKFRKKRVMQLQKTQIIVAFLFVITINIFIKNSNLPLNNIISSIGLEIDIEDSFGALIMLLYLPTFLKIFQEFKKNSERKKKEEEMDN